ncbi:5-formyltetrahydrofolate cyclo-ligase [Acholeplasma laidlawii]|jgi:5-formyltetrahydrofolate cyclo-ligase|uniref:5-formyltetrahydrofolate cyclo-ligase n=2 Tax=Acholeplasma laidlawii TaxID=2148 RepID=A9NDZ7_ACHLI|nr:5-formyltetrahydrofolate cyclo-ligase [Acholeplasma laidlawii]ABX81957.1 5-formyltetrahydrofolate cyclo-ligase [Acholeplasma laidlawii PG-8A]NWH10939.1 5-formyltetrahydrofolate cyclo-ligase [Acholeplasma laidlawii]NWH12325.1 5-formyltetrahydrofolate cyclo-ligase [Acholeplasma laidlawii]NWH13711.1 5-formyltetrahydrofolate cyclo-ligase [Acholeplasma laidlawii]NWH15044.1 5-formyltetrahydrofolate cyclo-ligase [Acholeplasma laidlawii]
MKKVLRKQIIEARLGISQEQRLQSSKKVMDMLSEEEHFLKADFVGIFYPTQNEMDLTPLIEKYPDKIFAYPKIVNDKIQFLQVDKTIELKKSHFGVSEPSYGFDITSKLEVIIVPALGMTKTNYRLGYGKGYYDKFFKVYQNPYKIGIIYEQEEVSFEPQAHDVPLDTYFKG